MCRFMGDIDQAKFTDRDRIFENQHLLDATEIFRKLNVHKKVSHPKRYGPYMLQVAHTH